MGELRANNGEKGNQKAESEQRTDKNDAGNRSLNYLNVAEVNKPSKLPAPKARISTFAEPPQAGIVEDRTPVRVKDATTSEILQALNGKGTHPIPMKIAEDVRQLTVATGFVRAHRSFKWKSAKPRMGLSRSNEKFD